MELKDALAELSRWTYSTGAGHGEPWTRNHEVRWVDFLLDGGKVIGSDYNCPKGGFNAYDALVCMVTDASYADEHRDVADFLEGLGYLDDAKSVREGVRVWKSCCGMLSDFKSSGVDIRRMLEVFAAVDENSADHRAEAAIRPCEGEFD